MLAAGFRGRENLNSAMLSVVEPSPQVKGFKINCKIALIKCKILGLLKANFGFKTLTLLPVK